MAKGYVVGNLTVLDVEGYKPYAAAATAAQKQYGGTPLVRGGRCEIVEGEARMRQIVIEFESYEAAKTYFFSPFILKTFLCLYSATLPLFHCCTGRRYPTTRE